MRNLSIFITLSFLLISIISGCGDSATPISPVTPAPTGLTPVVTEIPIDTPVTMTLSNGTQCTVNSNTIVSAKLEQDFSNHPSVKGGTFAGDFYNLSLSVPVTISNLKITLPIQPGSADTIAIRDDYTEWTVYDATVITKSEIEQNKDIPDSLKNANRETYLTITLPEKEISSIYFVALKKNSLTPIHPVITPTGSPQGRKWTYMVYIAGDNNLSNGSLKDMEKMTSIGSGSDTAIVVQAKFSKQYSGNSIPSDVRRYYIEKSNTFNINNYKESLGDIPMASSENITDFIKWSVKNYPAEHYCFVFSDHGGGWKDKGALQDGTGNLVSLPDLAGSVKNSGVKFDIINFDCCLMGMYEVAYEFKDLCNYMVIAEQIMRGQPYDKILGDLTQNPSISPKEFSINIANRIYELYLSFELSEIATISVMDMSLVDDFDQKVRTLARSLIKANDLPSIEYAQSYSQKYYYTANHDIYDFCIKLEEKLTDSDAKNASLNLRNAVNLVIIKNLTINHNTSHGIAIYVPKKQETTERELSDYALLACNKAKGFPDGTWGALVNYIISGQGTLKLGPGGFAVKITWPEDSEVKLYSGEPGYIPWNNVNTANGTFNSNIEDSNKDFTYDIFTANSKVETGNYYFEVLYERDGSKSKSAKVMFYIYDMNKWKFIAEKTLTSANNGQNPWYVPIHYEVTETSCNLVETPYTGSNFLGK